MSGVPSSDELPSTPAGEEPVEGGPGGASALAQDGEALGEHVREVLAELDGAELAAHPEMFEGLSAAILDELHSLEEL